MASWSNTDIWTWIQNLRTTSEWKSDSMSICICSSGSSSPDLNLSAFRSSSGKSVTLSLVANFSLPIYLWTSKPVSVSSNSAYAFDEEGIRKLLVNFIQDILEYGPSKTMYHIRIPSYITQENLKDIFNFTLLTLSFLICIYEAPAGLRCNCLNAIKDHLSTSQLIRDSSMLLMRILGSTLEEQWMRTLNLAITNWKMEFRAVNRVLKCPSPIYSSAVSSFGTWKVQFYCPIISMDIVNSSNKADEKLTFSLNYHQLEGVIQLNYKVIIQEKWVDVQVIVDNVRLDVIPLVSEGLLNERGAGAAEKHFPSRISVQLTPALQREILSVSVSKSSENPESAIEMEKSIEGSFEPPKQVGLKISAGETRTSILKPWKFEEYAHGNSGNLNWFLYDAANGKEVFSSKPSKVSLFQHNSWFKNRYSTAFRPFTRQGGVIFAADEYTEKVCWKLDKSMIGKRVECDIKGFIGLTYWPNKSRTFYNETRRAEFREKLYLTLV